MNLFSPLVSKRLYCVLMSCCGYPSRNPSSLLDPWPLPPPRPARTICSIRSSSPLASYAAQRHQCALQAEREPSAPRRSHGRRVPEPRRDASLHTPLFLDPVGDTRRWICLPFVCAWNVDDRVRITSGGANPCFMPDLPIRLRRRVDASGPGRRREAFFGFCFFFFLEESSRAAGCMHKRFRPTAGRSKCGL